MRRHVDAEDGIPIARSAARETNTPVSVLMPVYNGERYVAQAIDSVLAQTYRHFELIIVNDGSIDRTAEILDDFAARDERIRVIAQPNRGQPAALNRGLELARYEWVAIIDHDDISLPHRLERQLAVIRAHPDVRLVGTYAQQIDALGQEFGRIFVGVTTVAEFRELRASGSLVSLVHPSVMMHRPTVLAVGGYNPDFGPAMDTELWSRVADDHLVLVVPEPLVLYRIHQHSMSTTRFFDARRNERWILARQLARRAGRPVPSKKEFFRQERRELGLGWLRMQRDDWIAFCLHCWRLETRERSLRLRMVSRLGLLITSPAYARRKLKRARQLLSTLSLRDD